MRVGDRDVRVGRKISAIPVRRKVGVHVERVCIDVELMAVLEMVDTA